MFFKPRIFISSLMKNKLTLRSEIEGILSCTGAEVLLYEKNLTPSVKEHTYRWNIKDADFVIMILDENYGTKTNTGYSGVEEEFEIAIVNNLRMHIYIKNSEITNPDQNEFVEKIKERGISYYFYKDENDLLKRIKASIMTIARDVAVNQFSFSDLKNKEKMVFDYDYDIAVGYLAINDEMVKCHNSHCHDYLDTDIVNAFLGDAASSIFYNHFRFNDTKLYDLFFNAFKKIESFINQHYNDYTSNGNQFVRYCPIYKEVTVTDCSLKNSNKTDSKWYHDILEEYFSSIDEIKQYLSKRKIDFDCRFKE